MIKIILSKDKIALIDNEDYDLINQYKWCAVWDNFNWYAVTSLPRLNGSQIKLKMHQLIMGRIVDKEIDHKDGDGLNNQKYNLRFCTNMENQQNQKKCKTYNKRQTSSIFKGVHWNKLSKKWQAQITYRKKHIHLGFFKVETEAALAYNNASLKYFTEYAKLNRIEVF